MHHHENGTPSIATQSRLSVRFPEVARGQQITRMGGPRNRERPLWHHGRPKPPFCLRPEAAGGFATVRFRMATIESGQLSRGGSWTDGIRRLWAVGAEGTYARAVEPIPTIFDPPLILTKRAIRDG
jgi:hypothetical protein